MGLSAIVYKQASNLVKTYGKDRIEIDAETGEAILKDGLFPRIPDHAFVAVTVRLGNLDKIRFLREKFENTLISKESVIMARVLYSATHAGDSIDVEKFPKLKEEISILRKQDDPSINEFIEAMEILIKAGETEQNPIVFV